MEHQIEGGALLLLSRRRQGVSLLELLLGIGIVALLAMLALPLYNRFGLMKDQTICSSNLRQIGAAVLNYASDHRGMMPGPMGASQRASYTAHQIENVPAGLLHYIAPYLGLVPPPSRQMAKVFECPAQKKLRNGEDDPSYYLHRTTVLADGVRQRPFGYRASGATPIDPMPLASVIKPSETVAIFDTSGPAGQTEVHSGSRNVLFIDGHTESVESSRLIYDASSITIQ